MELIRPYGADEFDALTEMAEEATERASDQKARARWNKFDNACQEYKNVLPDVVSSQSLPATSITLARPPQSKCRLSLIEMSHNAERFTVFGKSTGPGEELLPAGKDLRASIKFYSSPLFYPMFKCGWASEFGIYVVFMYNFFPTVEAYLQHWAANNEGLIHDSMANLLTENTHESTQYAFKKGVTVRDRKWGNVMFVPSKNQDSRFISKTFDFDVAKLKRPPDEVIKDGRVVGSKGYTDELICPGIAQQRGPRKSAWHTGISNDMYASAMGVLLLNGGGGEEDRKSLREISMARQQMWHKNPDLTVSQLFPKHVECFKSTCETPDQSPAHRARMVWVKESLDANREGADVAIKDPVLKSTPESILHVHKMLYKYVDDTKSSVLQSFCEDGKVHSAFYFLAEKLEVWLKDNKHPEIGKVLSSSDPKHLELQRQFIGLVEQGLPGFQLSPEERMHIGWVLDKKAKRITSNYFMPPVAASTTSTTDSLDTTALVPPPALATNLNVVVSVPTAAENHASFLEWLQQQNMALRKAKLCGAKGCPIKVIPAERRVVDAVLQQEYRSVAQRYGMENEYSISLKPAPSNSKNKLLCQQHAAEHSMRVNTPKKEKNIEQ